MGTTSNYSWPTPEATDLVKDGWEAIKDLGDAIDTTVAGLPGAGLVHIKTETFSAVASHSLANNTFNANYDNYLMILKISAATVDAAIYMKSRKAGTDASTAYYYAAQGLDSNNSAFNAVGSNLTTGFLLMEVDSGTSAKPTFATIQLNNIFVNGHNNVTYESSFARATGPQVAWNGGGVHANADSYDAVSFIASAGAITGSVLIYGFKG